MLGSMIVVCVTGVSCAILDNVIQREETRKIIKFTGGCIVVVTVLKYITGLVKTINK